MWVMRSRLGSVLLVGLVGDGGKEATHVVILLGLFVFSERRRRLYDCMIIIYIYTLFICILHYLYRDFFDKLQLSVPSNQSSIIFNVTRVLTSLNWYLHLMHMKYVALKWHICGSSLNLDFNWQVEANKMTLIHQEWWF